LSDLPVHDNSNPRRADIPVRSHGE
jgi:hypothetical protein